MKSKSRRHFIWTSAIWTSGAIATAWGVHRLWPHPEPPLATPLAESETTRLFLGASYKTQKAAQYDLSSAGAFAFRIDERGRRLQQFPISVPAHSVNPIPHLPHRALAVSSRTGLASLIDWREQKEVRRLELPDGHVLQGHVVYRSRPDGTSTALISASQRRGSRMAHGRLIEVELENLQIVQSHPLEAGFPHEMLAIGHDHIIMGMAGLQRSGSRFGVHDAVSGKIEKLPSLFEIDEWRGMAHFILVQDSSSSQISTTLPRWSIWSSNTRRSQKLVDPALVFLDLQSLRADKVMFPDELRQSELLSMVYHPNTGQVWGTLPDLNKAFVFDVDSRRLIKVLDFPYRVTFAGLGATGPRNVILGGGAHFSIWDAEKLEKLDEQSPLAIISPSAEFNISHLREAAS